MRRIFPNAIEVGVFSANNVIGLWDDVDSGFGVDISAEEWMAENPDFDPDVDEWDAADSDYLLGYRKNEEGKYEPDPKAEYSAEVMTLGGAYHVWVTRSRWLIKGAQGSPCIWPNVDADSEGDLICYSLPPDMLEDEERKRAVYNIDPDFPSSHYSEPDFGIGRADFNLMLIIHDGWMNFIRLEIIRRGSNYEVSGWRNLGDDRVTISERYLHPEDAIQKITELAEKYQDEISRNRNAKFEISYQTNQEVNKGRI